MPHERPRHLLASIQKAGKLWPVVGLLGPRQSGKSTLLTRLLQLKNSVSLDDLEARTEANQSPKPFLSKFGRPLVIDEVQKAPALFDAIKYSVDKKKIPGSYYLTGSSTFSSKIGIRESLTGRIGLFELHPLTLSELEQKPLSTHGFNPVLRKSRFDIETFSKRMVSGGMPVPAFLRDQESRDLYWQSWLETTLYRDLSVFFKRGYDADYAYSILNRMVNVMREGEVPTLKHFSGTALKVRRYLDAMSDIFLVKKARCHDSGVGKDIWYIFDSGLLAHLLKSVSGEEVSLSLARHFLMNEVSAKHSFQGIHHERLYFKTARSGIVDFILNGVPFKVVGSTTGITRQRAWEEKPLLSAMKHLNSKIGFLIAPTENIEVPKKGVGVIPWHFWS